MEPKLQKQALLLLGVFVLYLTLGAFVFHILEGRHEKQVRLEVFDYLRRFRKTHTCIEDREFKELIVQVILATENGVFQDLQLTRRRNPNDTDITQSEYHQWDIFNSFFFSSTVVTTIGYGNLSPKTIGGRSFCIVYALIGIPLTGWLLNVIGKCFMENWKNMAKHLIVRLSFISNKRARKISSFLVIGCIVYTFTIIIPSLSFMFIEQWNFFESQYFCLISLTTIGFGDYVITNDPDISLAVRAVYKICSIIYLIVGLSIVMITLKVIEDMETKKAKYFGRISKKIRKQVLESIDKSKGRKRLDINGAPLDESMAYRATIYTSGSNYESDQACI